jgi:integrase/recombinase XerD
MHNPASELELPRPETRLPVAGLTPAEVARLCAVPDLADPLGLRDRAMLETLYASGIRRAELARLECADVNLGRGTLTVRQGKGGKDRVVPLGARAAAWVARYLDEVRPRLMLEAREPGLFLTGYGEPFHPDVLTRMMTAWLKAAGLPGRGSCHLMRHTCATHMLENGADVRYIQQLLGHASLETTAIYTEVTINQLLAVHARCHPSAQTQNPATPQNAASVAP